MPSKHDQEYLRLIKALRLRRFKLGLSKTDLAKRLKITTNTLYLWETGRYVPPVMQVLRWADALDLRVVLAPQDEGEITEALTLILQQIMTLNRQAAA